MEMDKILVIYLKEHKRLRNLCYNTFYLFNMDNVCDELMDETENWEY